MKLFSLLVCSCLCNILYSQVSIDTAWWLNKEHIQSITKREGQKFTIQSWHRNGRQMSFGIFNLKNGLVPATNMIIVDSNGRKVQEYIVRDGTLINYMEKGKVKDILQSHLHDTAETYTEYYSNGNIKTLKYSRKDTGRNGIYFFVPSYGRPISFMYQQEVNAAYLYQQFYPDGKVYMQQEIRRIPEYKLIQQWFRENGEVDTGAYIDKGKSGYSNDKMGRRLEWWNNGKLKSEDYFKANHNDSVQRTWHENGKLQMEKFFENGSVAGILRIWHANGRLRYYSDYRTNSTGKPSLTFHENGMIANQSNDISSVYDEKGNLTYELISIGRYSRSFDLKNGTPSNNAYQGKFNKMRKGRWRAYDNKGRKMYSAFYKDGLLEGEVLLFDTSGSIAVIANYKEGRFHGKYLEMNSNGVDTLMFGFYDLGRRNGIWRIFHNNGKLQAVQLFKNKEYYELESYDQSGNALTASRYDEDEKALYQYYYRDGKLTSVNVKHDDRTGVDQYYYHVNGTVSQANLYDKDGGYLRKTFYDNGQQESEAYFKPGNYAHGKQYRWYISGQKKLEGEMINGYQEGEWMAYNEDGSIKETYHYIKGIQQVQAPSYTSCFCNKPMPAIAGSSFFNSTGSFMELNAINRVMKKFQLDTAYNYTFLRCYRCWPIPVIAVREQKLWIGKDGMYLNLTPCMHGNNRSLINLERVELKTIKDRYSNYDDDSDLVKPLTLTDVFDRAISYYQGDYYMNYKNALSTLSGDTSFFYRLLKKHFNTSVVMPDDDEEAEQLAMEAAAESYDEKDTAEDDFTRHFASVLAKAVLPYFPGEAKVLSKDSTDRDATSAIFRRLFEQHEPQYLEEKLYGSIEAVMDSGTVSLKIPSSFIAAWDTVADKKVMADGKPADVPFMISFRKAYYHSYPSDRFVIPSDDAISYCAPPFTAGNTGVWIRPDIFRYALGNGHGSGGDEQEAAFTPYDYPAHYKNIQVHFNDMYRDVRADLDDYIKNFMGVIVREGSMHLPGIKKEIPVKNVLIDAKEMNGCIKIPANETSFSEAQLKLLLESAGFTVYYRNAEWDRYEEPSVILYFHLKNK